MIVLFDCSDNLKSPTCPHAMPRMILQIVGSANLTSTPYHYIELRAFISMYIGRPVMRVNI